ncbi:hypothetical protein ACGFT2_30345 [Streptomyces sp. NPDC048514]|uniref:hypothetical protein n=1 Tax=Streptomyces sp. NPDC048514 TaxID=3365564 RepID=UPI00371EC184
MAGRTGAAPQPRHRLRGHTFELRSCATELLMDGIDRVGEGAPATVGVTGGPGPARTRTEVTGPDPPGPAPR